MKAIDCFLRNVVKTFSRVSQKKKKKERKKGNIGAKLFSDTLKVNIQMAKKCLVEDKISVIMQSHRNSLAKIDFDFLLGFWQKQLNITHYIDPLSYPI